MYTGIIKVNLFTRVHVNMNFIKKSEFDCHWVKNVNNSLHYFKNAYIERLKGQGNRALNPLLISAVIHYTSDQQIFC